MPKKNQINKALKVSVSSLVSCSVYRITNRPTIRKPFLKIVIYRNALMVYACLIKEISFNLNALVFSISIKKL